MRICLTLFDAIGISGAAQTAVRVKETYSALETLGILFERDVDVGVLRRNLAATNELIGKKEIATRA